MVVLLTMCQCWAILSRYITAPGHQCLGGFPPKPTETIGKQYQTEVQPARATSPVPLPHTSIYHHRYTTVSDKQFLCFRTGTPSMSLTATPWKFCWEQGWVPER